MGKMIATYVAGGAEDSETYESNTPYDVDLELPMILKAKYRRRELWDDFRILCVYDVEMDNLVEFFDS